MRRKPGPPVARTPPEPTLSNSKHFVSFPRHFSKVDWATHKRPVPMEPPKAIICMCRCVRFRLRPLSSEVRRTPSAVVGMTPPTVPFSGSIAFSYSEPLMCSSEGGAETAVTGTGEGSSLKLSTKRRIAMVGSRLLGVDPCKRDGRLYRRMDGMGWMVVDF